MANESDEWPSDWPTSRSKRAAGRSKPNESAGKNYEERVSKRVAQEAHAHADTYKRQLGIEDRYSALQKTYDGLSKQFKQARVQFLRETNHLRSCLRRAEERLGSLAEAGIDSNVYFFDAEYYEEEHIKLFAEAVCIRALAEDNADYTAGLTARVTDRMGERIKVLEMQNEELNSEVSRLMVISRKKLTKEDVEVLEQIAAQQQAREETATEWRKEEMELNGSAVQGPTGIAKMKGAVMRAKFMRQATMLLGKGTPAGNEKEFDRLDDQNGAKHVRKFGGFLPFAATTGRAKAAFLVGSSNRGKTRREIHTGIHDLDDHNLAGKGLRFNSPQSPIKHQSSVGFGKSLVAPKGMTSSTGCTTCQTRKFQIQVLESEIHRLRNQLGAEQTQGGSGSFRFEVLSITDLHALIKAIVGDVELPTRKSELVAMLTNAVEGSQLMGEGRKANHGPNQTKQPGTKSNYEHGKAVQRSLVQVMSAFGTSRVSAANVSTEMPSVSDDDSVGPSRWSDDNTMSGVTRVLFDDSSSVAAYTEASQNDFRPHNTSAFRPPPKGGTALFNACIMKSREGFQK